MRKLFFLILAALFVATPLSAQHFGLRAGVNATNASIDITDLNVETEGETNLMLGLFVELPIGGNTFVLQPEINYLNRGYSYTIDLPGSNEISSTLTYFDLGVLAKLNFGREEGLGFYLGAGPTFSYALNGTVTEIGGERDVDFDADRINRGGLNVTGVAGLTFDIGLKLFAEFRYNAAVSNLFDVENTDVRQNYLGINGGVLVPIGN
ncbi:porin family protein [Neolewinella persica]|uniref:porin family protein n=1 Tax=Neolewinella persica TaxID=70998 RepID=UPI00036A23F3|nr:porin family protein [Neolewinella persica]